MHTEKKLYTVTVGIPAHNEEANIEYLLKSVLFQKGNFILEKVVVFADGCTDGTEQIVHEISEKYPIVQLVSGGERKGKSIRLNQLHISNTSDIVINFDADIILETKFVIQKMLTYFDDKSVGVVSANNQPLRGMSFIEKVTNEGDNLWYEVRKDFNGGDNIYNCSGCAIAMRHEFARTVVLSEKTVADQQAVYIALWHSGKKMAYAKDTIVHYRTPSTLDDFFNQAGRSLVEKYYFPEHDDPAIQGLYHIPLKNKIFGIVRGFTSDPLYTMCAIILQIVLRFQFTKQFTKNLESKWEMVTSTKSLLK